MKQSDLEILLQEGEGSMLEYKESISSSLARELVAFANSGGGRILLGVRDDGSVKGIEDTNDLRARIQDIARNCDPPVNILLERVGNITAINVRESSGKPVQCSDGFFWRQGAVTQKLTREEIRASFQKEGTIRFDLSICTKFKYPDDFDSDKFSTWLNSSGISRRGEIEDVLVNIEAAERSSGNLLFRNAGVLFFAKEPRRFFNQAYITCILYKGTTKVHVLDRKDFAGGAASDIEECMRFIERNTRTAYRIEKLRREDIPEYPIPSLREAITNAVMHRDWFNEGSNVFVEISADHIAISNPGGLPPGMQQSDLGHRSVRRNPIIADLFHRIGFIEKAGTGIRRMREGAREMGYPEPEFNVDGFFSVIFYPMIRNENEVGFQDGTKWAPSGHQVGTKKKLSQEQFELLTTCQNECTLVELLSRSGRSDRSKFRNNILIPLIQDGLIEMTIPDKPRSQNQRYHITSSGIEFLKNAGRRE